MPLTVSVIIPVYNAARYLQASLEHLRNLSPPPLECLVVDDGSTDESAAIARRAGAIVICAEARRGPAVARNLGARAATGDILFFLDADVLVYPDAVSRVVSAFMADPALDALIGSYDDAPGSASFVSQYRNLLHCFVHQNSRTETSTFWTGCGAVRRQVFEAHSGFRETYWKPYLEDIEFGWRLTRAGRRIRLDRQLRVKHLKNWGIWETFTTDLLGRAVPWTHLILRFRSMPADLNLRWEHRLSVWLVCLLVAAAALEVGRGAIGVPPAPPWLWAAAVGGCAIAVVLLNLGFYRFLAERKGWWFALRTLPLHCLYFLSGGAGFALGLLLYPLEARRVTATEPQPSGEAGAYSRSSGSSK
jgi:glycosyltransferase involved in cell wall biosynthesis